MNARPEGSRVVMEWIDSAALAGNPLGDPAARAVPVLLPPGYAEDGARRYPALYGLTGFTGRGTMLLNDSPWEPGLLERVDRLYREGMPPAIIVLPDCLTRLGGSQYLNSSATGRYEDHLMREVIPLIDGRYRTQAGARGVFGKSSGGYGSLMLALRHPGLFQAVACHSGDMGFDLAYALDFPKAATALAAAGGVAAWMQRFEAAVSKDREDVGVLNILAMAAAYSPDPAAPWGLALPFDLETCAIDEAVWQRWLAWDPLALLEQAAEALRGLRLLYLDCGASDEFFLYFGARRFTRRLRELEIAHQYEEFDGGHFNIARRYDVSLPRLARALNAG